MQVLRSEKLNLLCEAAETWGGRNIDLGGKTFRATADATPQVAGKCLVPPENIATESAAWCVGPGTRPQLRLVDGAVLCNGELHLPDACQLVVEGDCVLKDIVIQGTLQDERAVRAHV